MVVLNLWTKQSNEVDELWISSNGGLGVGNQNTQRCMKDIWTKIDSARFIWHKTLSYPEVYSNRNSCKRSPFSIALQIGTHFTSDIDYSFDTNRIIHVEF